MATFTYGNSLVAEQVLFVAIKNAKNSGGTAVSDSAMAGVTGALIGVIGEKPTMKVASGQTIPINSGIEIVTEETVEANFDVLQVSNTNYGVLREVINGSCDIMYGTCTDPMNPTIGTFTAKYTATGLSFYPELDITGNDQNKISCKAMKRIGAGGTPITLA